MFEDRTATEKAADLAKLADDFAAKESTPAGRDAARREFYRQRKQADAERKQELRRKERAIDLPPIDPDERVDAESGAVPCLPTGGKRFLFSPEAVQEALAELAATTRQPVDDGEAVS